MNPDQAEKIINAYGNAIVMSEGLIAKPKSLLPCSTASIKYAFYVYIKSLIQENLLGQNTGENLVQTYGWLCSFFDDAEAERINLLRNTEPQRHSAYAADILSQQMKMVGEINEYITECYNEFHAG